MWTKSLFEYIRHNDKPILEQCDQILRMYQEELLPCESFLEFVDVIGRLSINMCISRFFCFYFFFTLLNSCSLKFSGKSVLSYINNFFFKLEYRNSVRFSNPFFKQYIYIYMCVSQTASDWWSRQGICLKIVIPGSTHGLSDMRKWWHPQIHSICHFCFCNEKTY